MTEPRELRAWAQVAVATLALAGVMALLLALSRAPVVQDLLPWDGQSFFRKALVTHVVYSFVAWFLCLLAIVALTADGRRNAPSTLARLGPILAALGAAVLAVPALFEMGEPSLNDYVPLIDHPLFFIGLGLFAAGVALPVVRLLLSAAPRSGSDGFAAACLGAVYLLAVATVGVTWQRLPDWLEGNSLWDSLFWGGGHLLQVVNTGLVMIAWDRLLRRSAGNPALGGGTTGVLFALLLLIALPGPVVPLLVPPEGLEYREFFTDLYLYALVLPPAMVMIGTALRMYRAPGWKDTPEAPALILSLILFALGGLAGYALGFNDTRTPAHYHAVIGAVNLTFMTWMLTELPERLGCRRPGAKWVRRMGWWYGLGQLLHSIGLFAAGTLDVERKVAGAEQGLDSLEKKIAMGVAGTGGLLAVIGGIVFVVLAIRMLAGRQSNSGG